MMANGLEGDTVSRGGDLELDRHRMPCTWVGVLCPPGAETQPAVHWKSQAPWRGAVFSLTEGTPAQPWVHDCGEAGSRA